MLQSIGDSAKGPSDRAKANTEIINSMFTARALLLALAALGAEAFSASPVGASRLTAARTARQSVSMGTFVEELKFKRFFNRFTFAVRVASQTYSLL